MIFYLAKKNKKLTTYGIEYPVKKKQTKVNKMGNEEYKEATSGDVIKFEKEGDSLEGKYMGYEESATYKDSFALKVKTTEGLKVVFVSSIVVDLISSNNIQKEQQIKLVYNGMIQNKAKTFKYKDYKLLFK